MQALIDPEGVSKPFLKDFWDIHEISSYTGIGLGTLYDIVKNPDYVDRRYEPDRVPHI